MTQSCTNIVISRWQIQVADTGSLCDGVIPVLDTGIQSLLCSHLFKVRFSGSQCQALG
uniref:hypothetical protein n=1 Tax=Wolbachia endosymbiont (group A) of Apoderus coryli TaxID=2953980 RepID=UPI00397C6274